MKEEQKKKIEQMTVDFFQPEKCNLNGTISLTAKKHGLKRSGTKSSGKPTGEAGSPFRMGVNAGQPMALVFEYWGGFPGSRTFDILVNDTKIATENLSNVKPGEFFYKTYELPDQLTVNGGRINVKVVPVEGHRQALYSVSERSNVNAD